MDKITQVWPLHAQSSNIIQTSCELSQQVYMAARHTIRHDIYGWYHAYTSMVEYTHSS